MPAVPTPPSFATDQFLGASDLNNVVAPINFLQSPPVFSGYSAAAQTLATGTWTPLTLDTEYVDSANGHSTVTNTSRYVAQYGGSYYLSGLAAFTGNATGSRSVSLSVNGTFIKGTGVAVSASGTDSVTTVTAALVHLNAGDYVEVQGWQNSGGGLATVTGSPEYACAMHVFWISL